MISAILRGVEQKSIISLSVSLNLVTDLVTFSSSVTKLSDKEGNKITDDDRTIIGNGQPKHTGGFSNNFVYKNWDLNIFLQLSYGNDILNANRMVLNMLTYFNPRIASATIGLR